MEYGDTAVWEEFGLISPGAVSKESVDVGMATEPTRSFDSSLPSGMTDALLRAEGVWGHQISATIVHDPVTSSSFL